VANFSTRRYSLSKREPIKVTQSVRTERALGGIDLVQKRHQFVELPEYLLKEYWDALKKSMREIAGPKTSKYAKISCAEWLQVTPHHVPKHNRSWESTRTCLDSFLFTLVPVSLCLTLILVAIVHRVFGQTWNQSPGKSS
jgi:hypothetical protein